MDKYIEKIKELKRENHKLKKYKLFVEKSKDTNIIYNEIKDLQNQLAYYQNMETKFKHTLNLNLQLQTQIDSLLLSELTFANKTQFYRQQMEINQLEEKVEKQKTEKDKYYEDHKDTFERNNKLQNIVNKLKDLLEDVDNLSDSDSE